MRAEMRVTLRMEKRCLTERCALIFLLNGSLHSSVSFLGFNKCQSR